MTISACENVIGLLIKIRYTYTTCTVWRRSVGL